MKFYNISRIYYDTEEQAIVLFGHSLIKTGEYKLYHLTISPDKISTEIVSSAKDVKTLYYSTTILQRLNYIPIQWLEVFKIINTRYPKQNFLIRIFGDGKSQIYYQMINQKKEITPLQQITFEQYAKLFYKYKDKHILSLRTGDKIKSIDFLKFIKKVGCK